jgi:hypothetical protein
VEHQARRTALRIRLERHFNVAGLLDEIVPLGFRMKLAWAIARTAINAIAAVATPSSRFISPTSLRPRAIFREVDFDRQAEARGEPAGRTTVLATNEKRSLTCVARTLS